MNPTLRIDGASAQRRLDERPGRLGFLKLIEGKTQHVMKIGGLIEAQSGRARENFLIGLSSGENMAFRVKLLGKPQGFLDRHGRRRRNPNGAADLSKCR